MVRGLFVLAVGYAAVLIQPIEAPGWINALVGLAVAVVIAFAEARLQDAAATSVLGGLLGFSVGLATARAIGSSLFWANTSDTRVQFFHSLVILILPYLGLVMGARKGEWLEPSKLASLFRDRKMSGVDVVISDLDFPSVKDVDMKLIELARSLAGQIVINDVNLNKIAQLRGIEVLNINDDGTMVVVDHARKLIGSNLDVALTSVLQTTAGRMIFGRILESNGAGRPAASA